MSRIESFLKKCFESMPESTQFLKKFILNRLTKNLSRIQPWCISCVSRLLHNQEQLAFSMTQTALDAENKGTARRLPTTKLRDIFSVLTAMLYVYIEHNYQSSAWSYLWLSYQHKHQRSYATHLYAPTVPSISISEHLSGRVI